MSHALHEVESKHANVLALQDEAVKFTLQCLTDMHDARLDHSTFHGKRQQLMGGVASPPRSADESALDDEREATSLQTLDPAKRKEVMDYLLEQLCAYQEQVTPYSVNGDRPLRRPPRPCYSPSPRLTALCVRCPPSQLKELEVHNAWKAHTQHAQLGVQLPPISTHAPGVHASAAVAGHVRALLTTSTLVPAPSVHSCPRSIDHKECPAPFAAFPLRVVVADPCPSLSRVCSCGRRQMRLHSSRETRNMMTE